MSQPISKALATPQNCLAGLRDSDPAHSLPPNLLQKIELNKVHCQAFKKFCEEIVVLHVPCKWEAMIQDILAADSTIMQKIIWDFRHPNDLRSLVESNRIPVCLGDLSRYPALIPLFDWKRDLLVRRWTIRCFTDALYVQFLTLIKEGWEEQSVAALAAYNESVAPEAQLRTLKECIFYRISAELGAQLCVHFLGSLEMDPLAAGECMQAMRRKIEMMPHRAEKDWILKETNLKVRELVADLSSKVALPFVVLPARIETLASLQASCQQELAPFQRIIYKLLTAKKIPVNQA